MAGRSARSVNDVAIRLEDGVGSTWPLSMEIQRHDSSTGEVDVDVDDDDDDFEEPPQPRR